MGGGRGVTSRACKQSGQVVSGDDEGRRSREGGGMERIRQGWILEDEEGRAALKTRRRGPRDAGKK